MNNTWMKYDFREVARRSVPQFATGDWQYLDCSPCGEGRGRSASGCYSVSYRPSGQDGVNVDIVARLYRKRENRAAATHAAMLRLWEAGFRAPSPFRVVRPYGFSIDPPILFMEKAPGVPWRDLVFDGSRELVGSSARAADWLLRLHESDLPFLHRANRRIVAARVQRFAVELSTRFPELAPRLYSLSHSIVQALLRPGLLRPSHGDFNAGNMFLTPDNAIGIGLENLALREAAFDVGQVVGCLLMKSWYKTGSHDTGARAADVFMERYLSRGKLSVPRVRLHIGRSILQSIHLGCMARKHQVRDVEPWLKLAEQFVEGGAMPVMRTSGRARGRRVGSSAVIFHGG